VSWTACLGWADLHKHVGSPESAHEWKLKNKLDGEQSGDRIYDLQFVSQIWQENKWQHQLQVYRPRSVAPNSTIFLWVTGGSARPEYVSMVMELARKISARFAFLYHVPNQPLLEGNLCVDELI